VQRNGITGPPRLEEEAVGMQLLRRAVRGAAAGLVATGVMSALMVLSERAGLMPGQPPRMIVDRLAPELEPGAADAATLLSHGAYGAAAGAVFGGITRRGSASPLTGAVYGVLLWAAGYEAWVPALGVMPPAHRDDRARVLTMVLGHAVYGAVLGSRLARR
jgi:hypothetical protein